MSKTQHEEKAALNVADAAQLGQGLSGEAGSGQALAATNEKANAVVEYTYADDAGAGFENVGSDELLIPFVRILQALSPELEEGNAKYLEDAKGGYLINTATTELYAGKTGIYFIPVSRTHTYGEFTPRNSGGGFHGVWNADDTRIPKLRAEQGQFTKLVLENGHELVETFSFFGLVASAEEKLSDDTYFTQAVIGFSSTQIKPYRMMTARLAALIGSTSNVPGAPPPRFPIWAHVWHLTTVSQKNAKGVFANWSPRLYGGSPGEALLKPNSQLYLQGKAFHAFLKEGKATADYGQSGSHDEVDSEEIPF